MMVAKAKGEVTAVIRETCYRTCLSWWGTSTHRNSLSKWDWKGRPFIGSNESGLFDLFNHIRSNRKFPSSTQVSPAIEESAKS